MKKTKSAAVVLLAAAAVAALAGCGKKNDANSDVDKKASGVIDVMTWDGSQTYYEDIGHMDIAVEDLNAKGDAEVYAVAKAFNEQYPNVKINLWAIEYSDEYSWAQELENFKAEHGKYPDFYMTDDLAGEVEKGMVADLSVFKDDPVYQSYNPVIMDMLNYYGFQAGLPKAVNPFGVFVNRELASQNNIDIPPVDWTFDQYTDFVCAADCKNFWGSIDSSINFLTTANKDFHYALLNYSGEGDHVNLASDEMLRLLGYIPKWSKTAVWPQYDLGNVPEELMETNDWWGYSLFINNYLLTYDDDPYLLDYASNPTEDFWATANSSDWDYYPFPKTGDMENTVGLDIVPMAIRNYAIDDGNDEWSDEELEKLKTTYAFATFFAGSKEALKAKAEQLYMNDGAAVSCIDTSLPLVTGDAFDEYMEIWYDAPNHQLFKDEDKMPGFHKILDIFKEGKLWSVCFQVYPYSIYVDGTLVQCPDEWLNIWNPELVGASRTDPNWLDQVVAKAPDWNVKINERFAQADSELRAALKEYYGFKDEDFKKEI